MKAPLVLLCAASMATAQVPSGDDILAGVDANIISDSRISTSSMIIHERRQTRTLELKSWARGTTETFSEFLSPPRDRGTKMLKLKDQLWTFTPSTDRIILISGHMLRQSVMGSDLSYEDLLEEQRLRTMYTAQVRGEEERDGHPCWILDLTSRGGDVAYQSRTLWVDKERYVVMREERFARSGKLLKSAEAHEIRRFGQRWVATHVTFKDALKAGSGTEFRIATIDFDADIPAALFSKAALRK
jgi:hypothetical protein